MSQQVSPVFLSSIPVALKSELQDESSTDETRDVQNAAMTSELKKQQTEPVSIKLRGCKNLSMDAVMPFLVVSHIVWTSATRPKSTHPSWPIDIESKPILL
jgi:hypothetical protein